MGLLRGVWGEGVTFCSQPELGYWFNPVEILRDKLLAGASSILANFLALTLDSIGSGTLSVLNRTWNETDPERTVNLPSRINTILDLIKFSSRVMSSLFLASALLSTLLISFPPLSVLSRWWTLPIALLAFLIALFVKAASAVATGMFVIFRNVISSVRELNIGANVGTTMFAFMWVASAGAVVAAAVLVGGLCCCASQKDVRMGRKRGSGKAYKGGRGDGRGRQVQGEMVGV